MGVSFLLLPKVKVISLILFDYITMTIGTYDGFSFWQIFYNIFNRRLFVWPDRVGSILAVWLLRGTDAVLNPWRYEPN